MQSVFRGGTAPSLQSLCLGNINVYVSLTHASYDLGQERRAERWSGRPCCLFHSLKFFQLQISNLGLERWLRGQEHILLFQRTQLGLPASTSDVSQKPVAPAPGDLMSSFDLPNTQTHIFRYKKLTTTQKEFVKVLHFRVICPVIVYVGIVAYKVRISTVVWT